MSQLEEILRISPVFDEDAKTVTLSFKDFNRIVEFNDLKDREIKRAQAEIETEIRHKNNITFRANELYNFTLSSFKKKVSEYLKQEGIKEKATNELQKKVEIARAGCQIGAPYYETYENLSQILQRTFDGKCPVFSVMLHFDEVELLEILDVLRALQEELHFDDQIFTFLFTLDLYKYIPETKKQLKTPKIN